MDFLGHILVGLIFGQLFDFTGLNLFLFVFGSCLPDLAVIPLWIRYKMRAGGPALHAFKRDKHKPLGLLKFYDFMHSILLIIILILIGIKFNALFYLAGGIFLHVLIDIPLHKRSTHSPGIFFPFKYRFAGIVDWYDIYYTTKQRLVIWSILVIINLIIFFIKP